MYSAVFEGIAVTAAVDFFEIQPGDDKPVKIHACYISQSTETGDAAEEMLRVEIIRGHATSGSGGTTTTVRALDTTNTVAGPTCETNNTTIAATGTTHILHGEAFNVRSGWVYIPTPECRPNANQGDATIVVRLMAAPADSTTLSGTLYFEVG
jgi:hypothetical protein